MSRATSTKGEKKRRSTRIQTSQQVGHVYAQGQSENPTAMWRSQAKLQVHSWHQTPQERNHQQSLTWTLKVTQDTGNGETGTAQTPGEPGKGTGLGKDWGRPEKGQSAQIIQRKKDTELEATNKMEDGQTTAGTQATSAESQKCGRATGKLDNTHHSNSLQQPRERTEKGLDDQRESLHPDRSTTWKEMIMRQGTRRITTEAIQRSPVGLGDISLNKRLNWDAITHTIENEFKRKWGEEEREKIKKEFTKMWRKIHKATQTEDNSVTAEEAETQTNSPESVYTPTQEENKQQPNNAGHSGNSEQTPTTPEEETDKGWGRKMIKSFSEGDITRVETRRNLFYQVEVETEIPPTNLKLYRMEHHIVKKEEENPPGGGLRGNW